MKLATLINNRPVFHKAAVMAWAHREGRFAFGMCRTLADRRRQLSNWLRKAWLAAKKEAAQLIEAEARNAAHRVWLAERAVAAVKLAASFGNDAEAIRWEIERENRRQHFHSPRLDALSAALETVEGRAAQ